MSDELGNGHTRESLGTVGNVGRTMLKIFTDHPMHVALVWASRNIKKIFKRMEAVKLHLPFQDLHISWLGMYSICIVSVKAHM